jgi:predicted DNA-binding ribbon-helix-helix protein
MPKPTSVLRRAIRIGGRPTGVSLEDQFWESFREIAAASGTTRPALLARIEDGHTGVNLSSAVRLFVLAHYRQDDRMSLKDPSENRHAVSSVTKRSIKIARR